MGLIAAPGSEKPKALQPGQEEEDEEGVDAEAQEKEDQPPVADAVLLEEFEQLEKKETKE